MRTGKSKATIDNLFHLYDSGRIDSVLILAPNNVHRNWVRRELPKHAWDGLPYEALAWKTSHASGRWATRREEAEGAEWRAGWDRLMGAKKLPILSVNSESLHLEVVKKNVARFVRDRRFLLVADEMQDFGRPGSKITRPARALARKAAFRRGLTGTPVANSPLRAFSQYEIVQPGALAAGPAGTYEEFERFHAEFTLVKTKGGRQFPQLSQYKNLDVLAERVARYSSLVRRDECPDLPELVRCRRDYDPTPEQLRVYRQLMTEFRADVESGEVISFVDAGARFVKLLQVLSGFIIGDNGEVRDLCPGGNPKMEALSTEVDLCPGAVVVWCAFREDCRRVAGRLRKDGRRVAEYHGGVSATQRDDAEDGLRDGRYDVLVAQPHSGGRGLDFSRARDMIWYSHTPDAEKRAQAEERCTVTGGSAVGVADIVAPASLEEYILDVVLPMKAEWADAVSGVGLREALDRMEI